MGGLSYSSPPRNEIPSGASSFILGTVMGALIGGLSINHSSCMGYRSLPWETKFSPKGWNWTVSIVPLLQSSGEVVRVLSGASVINELKMSASRPNDHCKEHVDVE